MCLGKTPINYFRPLSHYSRGTGNLFILLLLLLHKPHSSDTGPVIHDAQYASGCSRLGSKLSSGQDRPPRVVLLVLLMVHPLQVLLLLHRVVLLQLGLHLGPLQLLLLLLLLPLLLLHHDMLLCQDDLSLVVLHLLSWSEGRVGLR